MSATSAGPLLVSGATVRDICHICKQLSSQSYRERQKSSWVPAHTRLCWTKRERCCNTGASSFFGHGALESWTRNTPPHYHHLINTLYCNHSYHPMLINFTYLNPWWVVMHIILCRSKMSLQLHQIPISNINAQCVLWNWYAQWGSTHT